MHSEEFPNSAVDTAFADTANCEVREMIHKRSKLVLRLRSVIDFSRNRVEMFLT